MCCKHVFRKKQKTDYDERIYEDDDNDHDEENDFQYRKGTNEIVKIINQKCVNSFQNPSVFELRQCGHQV